MKILLRENIVTTVSVTSDQSQMWDGCGLDYVQHPQNNIQSPIRAFSPAVVRKNVHV